ncbi:MAG: S-methyl-5-thioribose-1-phosphate isomerase [Sedimentisphaerales bacterium]|nr:S-methyl-5-thioribose-1-phosphate isomerase [Sedimentisphaerales bacterium]
MVFSSVNWVGDEDGFIELIDQRQLPGKFVKLRCRDVQSIGKAIQTLAVRGAPAIGVAAGYGLVLAIQNLPENGSLKSGLAKLKDAREYLGSLRPTAVNLSWALDKVYGCAEKFVIEQSQANLPLLQQCVLAEANAICQEDKEMCRRIGQNGQEFIKNDYGILTHCNAGALATAGQGTALSIMYEAKKAGKHFKVYVDETRPLLQGARLTAWELRQEGIDVIVICDNMAGWLMKQGRINAVITGADRIAANGDAANKIGTYSLSILANHHRIPFYIAAPTSTFDLTISSGPDIPIEQRSADEVQFVGDKRTVPEGVKVLNPAFDVTQAEFITAIITERGIIEKPDTGKIATHLH